MMRKIFGALLFVVGMLLAGSDGSLFPLPNLIGCLMFVLFAALLQQPQKKELK